MNFNARAVIPENQQDKTKTYFDLRVKPGEKQIIKLLVSNSSDQELTLNIQPNTAITNQNGVIDYSQSKQKKDSSLVYNFADFVAGEKKVTLQPKESREVAYELTMPDKQFDGELLGGFYVREIEKATDEDAQKNVQIKNRYSIVIAVDLTETDKVIESKLQLNNVQAALENYRTVVTANLQNIKAKIEDQMIVSATVTQKGSTTVLHKAEKKDMHMAPNSNFDFPIDWGKQELQPGTYTLNMDVTTSGGHWTFSKGFEIQKKESEKLNSQAVDLKTEPKESSFLLWIIGGLALIISVLVGWMIRKNHKLKKEGIK